MEDSVKYDGISDDFIINLNKQGWTLMEAEIEGNTFKTFQSKSERGRVKFWRVCNLWKTSNEPCLYQHSERRRLVQHCQSKHYSIVSMQKIIENDVSAISQKIFKGVHLMSCHNICLFFPHNSYFSTQGYKAVNADPRSRP